MDFTNSATTAPTFAGPGRATTADVSSPTVPSLPIRNPATDVLPRIEQWREVARRAIAVPPSNPLYPTAQAALTRAAPMLHANMLALQQKQAVANNTDAPAGPGGLGTAITHFGQQASFGFSDELAGGFDALVASHFGGDPVSAYHRGVQEHQAYLAAGAQSSPTAALTGDVAGVASQLLYPIAIAKAPRMARFIAEATRPVGGIASFWKLGAGAAAATAPIAAEAGLNAAGHIEGDVPTRLGVGALTAGLTARHVFPWMAAGLGAVKGARFAADMWRNAGTATSAAETAAGSGAVAAPQMSAAEERIRAGLAKMGMKPADIENTVSRQRTMPGSPLYDPSLARTTMVTMGAHPEAATMTAARNAQSVPVGAGDPAQQEGARNAYNWMQGLGASPEQSAAGARNVAGMHRNMLNWDPRQGL